VTPQVLELLDRYQAKASFFCIARRRARPELVKRSPARHSVENHSYHHHTRLLFRHFQIEARSGRAQATVASITAVRRLSFARRRDSAARCSIRCWPHADCDTYPGRDAASTR